MSSWAASSLRRVCVGRFDMGGPPELPRSDGKLRKVKFYIKIPSGKRPISAMRHPCSVDSLTRPVSCFVAFTTRDIHDLDHVRQCLEALHQFEYARCFFAGEHAPRAGKELPETLVARQGVAGLSGPSQQPVDALRYLASVLQPDADGDMHRDL